MINEHFVLKLTKTTESQSEEIEMTAPGRTWVSLKSGWLPKPSGNYDIYGPGRFPKQWHTLLHPDKMVTLVGFNPLTCSEGDQGEAIYHLPSDDFDGRGQWHIERIA